MVNITKLVAQVLVRSGGLYAMKRIESGQTDILRILAYHRIGYPEQELDRSDPSLFTGTPEMFEKQMQMLAEDYSVVSLEDVIAAVKGEHELPGNAVLITFDDAYTDFGTYAWPILHRMNLPAILYVPTDFVDGKRLNFWWDRLYQAVMQTEHNTLQLEGIGEWTFNTHQEKHATFERLKHIVKHETHHRAMELVDEIFDKLELAEESTRSCLTWDDLKTMAEQGLTLGAHTRSHPLLSRVNIDEVRDEVDGSQSDIKQHIGRTWSTFAYPSGTPDDLADTLPAVLDDLGIELAVTMIEGHNRVGRDNPLMFNRVGMAHHLKLDELALTLTGIYNIYGTLKRR